MATDSRYSDAFTFLPQGGIIQEFRVGGRNIILSFPTAAAYKIPHPYMGATIGRVANRIENAKIQNLNGRSYELAANNGPNNLHGGAQGFSEKEFEGPTPTVRKGRQAVGFKYVSVDGEEGFPGTVEMRLWYIPTVEKGEDGKEKTSLEIEYEAELVGDEVEETVVSLTNHSYFNISAGPTLTGTVATLTTNLHLPVDANLIPTGSIEPYPEFEPNTPFTFTDTFPDPDHCFVLNPDPSTVPLDTRPLPLQKLLELHHPDTGIHFEALSTEPAFQFYAGKFVDVPARDGAPARGPRSGMCIEASRYVDAVNREEWRGMVVLRKGEVWGSRTVYRGWVE